MQLVFWVQNPRPSLKLLGGLQIELMLKSEEAVHSFQSFDRILICTILIIKIKTFE